MKRRNEKEEEFLRLRVERGEVLEEINLYTIYEWLYDKVPSDEEMKIFIEETNSLKYEFKLIPRKYWKSCELFFGFLEMLEHEYTTVYDLKYSYYTMITPLNIKKTVFIENEDPLLFTRVKNVKNYGLISCSGFTMAGVQEIYSRFNS
jgi:hypothetical protein